MKRFKEYLDNMSIDTLFFIWVIDTFIFIFAIIMFTFIFGVSPFEMILNYYAHI